MTLTPHGLYFMMPSHILNYFQRLPFGFFLFVFFFLFRLYVCMLYNLCFDKPMKVNHLTDPLTINGDEHLCIIASKNIQPFEAV